MISGFLRALDLCSLLSALYLLHSVHVRQDRCQRFRLGGIQGERLARQDMFAGVGVALGDFRGDRDQALVFQAPEGGCRGLGQGEQFLERQFAPFLQDAPDLLLSFCKLRRFARQRQDTHVKPFTPPGFLVAHGFGEDAFQGGLRRAAVVVADPAGKLEDFGRNERLRADDLEDRLQCRVGGLLGQPGYAAQHLARAERNLDAAADLDLTGQLRRDEVIELLAERQFQGDAGDHGAWLADLGMDDAMPTGMSALLEERLRCVWPIGSVHEVAVLT